MKKVLLLTVELRIVSILLALVTVVFGAVMFGRSYEGGRNGLQDSPENFLQWFFSRREPAPSRFSDRPNRRSREQRFFGMSGLHFTGGVTRQDGEAGYLAVARYGPVSEEDVAEPDGSGFVSARPPGTLVVDLIDLNRRKIVHSWNRPRSARLRFFVLPDGSLLFRGRGRVFRMDACSNVVQSKPLRAHHTIERDADGNFWSPWNVIPNTVPHKTPDFLEDGLVRFSPEGEVLSRISLWPALMRAGHSHLVYGNNEHPQTPWHMNDVEPVLRDGPFWRRGDLFVSLRNSSVVLLYRPATDEVVWLQAGPWLRQHDVDVVSDSEISVFSNNTFLDEEGVARVLGANEVHVHDFATGETRSPWREAMRRHDVRTAYQGGAAVFGDGGVMLEESRHGRVLMLSPDGERVWSYVNRASDGAVYWLQQSRWLDAEYGAGVARSIAAFDCGTAVN